MRKPRLNSAVATVAVETVFSFSRGASVSFVIVFHPLVIRGRAKREPGISSFLDVQLHIRGSRLRLAPERRLNKSTAHRPARRTTSRGNRNRSLHWPA